MSISYVYMFQGEQNDVAVTYIWAKIVFVYA